MGARARERERERDGADADADGGNDDDIQTLSECGLWRSTARERDRIKVGQMYSEESAWREIVHARSA